MQQPSAKAHLVNFKCVLLTAIVVSAVATPATRLTNGAKAAKGQFPHQVSVQWSAGGVYPASHVCGGAIIAPQWVLTAAYELKGLQGPLKVVAGLVNLHEKGPHLQSIAVSEVVLHPNYEGTRTGFDIALLRLNGVLVYSDVIKPIALPSVVSYPSGTARFSGWGKTGLRPGLSDDLRYGSIPLITRADCTVALAQSLPNRTLHDDNVCGLDSLPCQGDSGNPLVKAEVLVGLVSWTERTCGETEAPAVFTVVSYHLDFIRQTLNVLRDR